MTTTLTRAALAPAPPQAAPLTLDERLALAAHEMDHRLDQAAVAFEVNTAHLPASDPTGFAAPAAMPAVVPLQPHTTPIAGVLQRAHTRLATVGWCTGQQRDQQGAMCLVGAIRAEAGQGTVAEGDACAFLLDVIRRRFPNAESVPSWNDSQRHSGPVMHLLGEASAIADARGI